MRLTLREQALTFQKSMLACVMCSRAFIEFETPIIPINVVEVKLCTLGIILFQMCILGIIKFSDVYLNLLVK